MEINSVYLKNTGNLISATEWLFLPDDFISEAFTRFCFLLDDNSLRTKYTAGTR